MPNSQFPTLFSPVKIGSLQIKNRIAMAPMGTRLPTSSGYVTDELVNFYLARARGGAGLIEVQFTAVSPDGIASPRILALFDDKYIPGIRSMVEQIHQAGAKAAIQLVHGGAVSVFDLTGALAAGPSPVGRVGGTVPAELTVAEIERIIEDFGQAARRAKEAGLDAVELHGTHGYLMNQFLSPVFNRREDEWGGDVKRRARFAVEVIRRTRRYVGSDYPIIVRVAVNDYTPTGISMEDGKATARILEEAGADALNITAGTQETAYMWTPPRYLPYGVHAPLGEAIKRAVSIPVMLVGRIHDPQVAEDLLTSGKCDMATIGRQMLADPEFARKAEEGRADEIRPCLACTMPECHGRLFKGLPVGCVVNPTVAREAQFSTEPAKAPKKVLVVGGGPGGMEAARTAALRGHKVTLMEESSELGGLMKIASVPPHKDAIKRLNDYYRRQLELTNVDVRTNTRADVAQVEAEKPDVVIVATGGRPLMPAITGVPENTIPVWDVLSGKATVGERVAIIGGAEVGCETTEYLAEQGKKVTIIEMISDIAPGITFWSKFLLLKELTKYGVDYITNARAISVEGGYVTVAFGDTRQRVGPFDSVIIAAGALARNELSDQLKATGLDVRTVGDFVKPRTLAEAIREGFEAAYSV